MEKPIDQIIKALTLAFFFLFLPCMESGAEKMPLRQRYISRTYGFEGFDCTGHYEMYLQLLNDKSHTYTCKISGSDTHIVVGRWGQVKDTVTLYPERELFVFRDCITEQLKEEYESDDDWLVPLRPEKYVEMADGSLAPIPEKIPGGSYLRGHNWPRLEIRFPMQFGVDNIREQMDIVYKTDSLLLSALPDTFKEYCSMWKDVDNQLYGEESVMNHLLHSKTINYDKFIARVVNIAVGARPGAYHVPALHAVVDSLLLNNPRQLAEQLNSHSYEENVRFWAFLFGGSDRRVSKSFFRKTKYRVSRLKTTSFPGYRFKTALDAGFENSLIATAGH